jgi:predicted RecA/RadA family phage recombinase
MAKTNFFRGNLNAADVIDTDTVALIAGQYVKVGEVVVSADELIGPGFGAGSDQDNAAGRIYVDLKDGESTPGAINGKFRIMIQSSQDMPIGAKPVILDLDLAILASGATDRNGQIPFEFQDFFLSKDKKFVFYVKSTANATLTKANCTVNIDVTKQLV